MKPHYLHRERGWVVKFFYVASYAGNYVLHLWKYSFMLYKQWPYKIRVEVY